MFKYFLIAGLVLAAAAESDYINESDLSDEEDVQTERRVIDKKKACDVSQTITTSLSAFSDAAKKEQQTTAVLRSEKTTAYKQQKKVTVRATESHNKANKAWKKAVLIHSKCVGIQRTYESELRAQEPVIKNELECIAAINDVVDRLEGVKEAEATTTLLEMPEIPKEFENTKTAAAVEELIEQGRKTGRTGASVRAIRKLLSGLKRKLNGELQNLKNKVAMKKAECGNKNKIRKDKDAAHVVAREERKRQEKILARKDKELREAVALYKQVVSERKHENAVVSSVSKSTNAVCKTKVRKGTRKTTVCGLSRLILDLSEQRKTEHRAHIDTLKAFKKRMGIEKTDLGKAEAHRDILKKKWRKAHARRDSCRAALKKKTKDRNYMRKTIAKEKDLVELIRKKAECLTRASRKRRTNCRRVTEALEELQNSESGLLDAEALLELGRRHGEISRIGRLLNTLVKGLEKELKKYEDAWTRQNKLCKKREKQRMTALERYEGSKTVAKAAKRDYLKSKKQHDSYVLVLKQFRKELATESKFMKKARKNLLKLGKTVFGNRWKGGCTEPFVLKYVQKYPVCCNMKCMQGTIRDFQRLCLKNSARCSGFTFTTGVRKGKKGSGCTKRCGGSCGRVKFRGSRFGKGTYDWHARKKMKPVLSKAVFWKAGRWSKCSRKCDKGKKTRRLTCYSNERKGAVSHKRCRGMTRPPTSDDCLVKKCRFKWITGRWGKCRRGRRHRRRRCWSVTHINYTKKGKCRSQDDRLRKSSPRSSKRC